MCFCENEKCPYHGLKVTPGTDFLYVYKAVIPGMENGFDLIRLERHHVEGDIYLCDVCYNAVLKVRKEMHKSRIRKRKNGP